MLTESQKAKFEAYKSASANSSKAKERLANLFDDGMYTEIDACVKNGEDYAGVVTEYGYVD